MKIVLSGVETNNKGAELMLYAILQEIERKCPEAEIYIPYFAVSQGLGYIQTNLKLRYCPYGKILSRINFIVAILRKLHITPMFLYETFKVGNADYFLDASGFCFSDQLPMKEIVIKTWENTLKKKRRSGTKIIFLPQAYGPAEKDGTKRVLKTISQNADLILVREQKSWDYLSRSKVMDMSKVKLYPDFTILVKGKIPKDYLKLVGGVCIIPNNRMIEKKVISISQYKEAITLIAECSKNKGRIPFLLCHEEKSDIALVEKLKTALGDKVEVVTGLNALEIKGVISQSYLCISSRFHGVVSSLNSKVPCLSTSWSHKYSELYKDYGISECVLNIADLNSCKEKVEEYLSSSVNKEIKAKLEKSTPTLEEKTKQMWREVWK